MTPQQPAKVHMPAKPVERFDQVSRYMRRHGAHATFCLPDGIISRQYDDLFILAKSPPAYKFRRDVRIAFNKARDAGYNQ